MKSMTDKEKDTVQKEYDHYVSEFTKLDEYDPYSEYRSAEEIRERQNKHDYCLNMAKLKNFQLKHDIYLTSREEENAMKWFKEGFEFSFDFTVHTDDIDPVDEYYGFCLIDYLTTENEAFKDEVDQYRILRLINRHIYDDPEYCGKLIESFQIKELDKYLEEHPNGFNKAEIRGCRQWLDDGHAFWANPFGLADDNGCERNYLSALQHLR